MEILIYIYFLLNAFLAGCFFEWMVSAGKIKTAWNTIALILILFAGIPVFTVAAILTRND